jgi:hypothetical protein
MPRVHSLQVPELCHNLEGEERRLGRWLCACEGFPRRLSCGAMPWGAGRTSRKETASAIVGKVIDCFDGCFWPVQMVGRSVSWCPGALVPWPWMLIHSRCEFHAAAATIPGGARSYETWERTSRPEVVWNVLCRIDCRVKESEQGGYTAYA